MAVGLDAQGHRRLADAAAAVVAARVEAPRFEDGLDAQKSRFSGILSDLHLENPKELAQ